MSNHSVYHYHSPYFVLEIIASNSSLLSLSAHLSEGKCRKDINKIVSETVKQLDEYFAGKRSIFQLPLDMDQYTNFQRDVWKALTDIPYGETKSYREVAESIGKSSAVRAVGNACGKNPFLIVVPCHRVIKTDGSLGGFSAGIDLKKQLISFETNIISSV